MEQLPPLHCAKCGKEIEGEPTTFEKNTRHGRMTLPFCNQQHANDWYLEYLRSMDGR